MIKYKTVVGRDVPRAARRLARRDGLMKIWYDNHKDTMIATLLYKNNTLIGWCAAIRITFWGFHTKTVEISTYVHPRMRGKGFARKLLERTLHVVRIANPKTVVRYGTPSDHGYFNHTYEKTIGDSGLKPNRYFCA